MIIFSDNVNQDQTAFGVLLDQDQTTQHIKYVFDIHSPLFTLYFIVKTVLNLR